MIRPEIKNIDETHTSLPFSIKLKEAGFKGESEKIWWTLNSSKGKFQFGNKCQINSLVREDKMIKLSAYDIMNDLCIRYKIELFGDRQVCEWCGGDGFDIDNAGSGVYCDDCGKEQSLVPIYTIRTRQVLDLMQQGEKSKAEQYIIDTAVIFNKKNEGK